jgi:hypothetical protein
MNLRPLMTLLLMINLAATAMCLPQNVSKDLPAEQRDEKITPDEEREARELVARFFKRWQETDDIGPLIDEFFVADFADRLRHEPEMLFLGELKPELLLTTDSRDDLLRYYVAMTNLLRLITRLYAISAPINMSDGERGELDLKEMLPASIWELFKGNPITNAIINEELGEKAEGRTENPDASAAKEADAKSIKTIEQLRDLTATLEQANILLRDHLKTLPLPLPASEVSTGEISRSRQSDTDSTAAESNDPLTPRIHIPGEDFYGYPADTRLICFNVLPFDIDLVRDGDNRLKVLSVYLQTD